jgi:hypothetical protein
MSSSIVYVQSEKTPPTNAMRIGAYERVTKHGAHAAELSSCPFPDSFFPVGGPGSAPTLFGFVIFEYAGFDCHS